MKKRRVTKEQANEVWVGLFKPPCFGGEEEIKLLDCISKYFKTLIAFLDKGDNSLDNIKAIEFPCDLFRECLIANKVARDKRIKKMKI